MNPFLVLDEATGRVLRAGACSDPDQLDAQAGPGEVVIADPPSDVLADGRWHWNGSDFAQSPATLTDLKAQAKNVVRNLRDLAEWGGCNTSGGRVDSDPESQRKTNGSVTMALIAGAAFSIEWRMADNSVVTFNHDQMIAVGVALGLHVSACQNRKNELDAAIDAASSETTLAAIDLTAGWPS